MNVVSQPAETVLRIALSRPATLGSGRLICIDGPAGSGKTTLASEIHSSEPTATMLHADDLLEGWGGLPGLGDTLNGLLRDLAADRPGRWRRWDWIADGWAEWHQVSPGGLLVLEGVGTGDPAYADLVTVLVWVEVDGDLRMQRGLARDGEALRGHWLRWREEEDLLFAADRTAGAGGHACPRRELTQLGLLMSRRSSATARRARPVGTLDPHRRLAGAVGEVEHRPRSAGRQVGSRSPPPRHRRDGGSR